MCIDKPELTDASKHLHGTDNLCCGYGGVSFPDGVWEDFAAFSTLTMHFLPLKQMSSVFKKKHRPQDGVWNRGLVTLVTLNIYKVMLVPMCFFATCEFIYLAAPLS